MNFIPIILFSSFIIILSLLLLDFVYGNPIATVGDINCRRGLNNTKAIMDTGLPFLGLGDYFYRDKQKCIDKLSDVLKEIKIRFGIVGNHELLSKNFTAAYEDIFGLPINSYFKAKINDTLIIGTNVHTNYEVNSKQYNMIAGWLNDTRKEDKIIVLVHTPLINPGGIWDHPTDSVTKFGLTFIELFDRKGVDLVLSGDLHLYGYLDRGGDGFDQVICGIGGHGRHALNKNATTDYHVLERMPPGGGFCVVDLEQDYDRKQIKFYNKDKELLHEVSFS